MILRVSERCGRYGFGLSSRNIEYLTVCYSQRLSTNAGPSVNRDSLPSVTLCVVARRYVLEQKFQLAANRKSYEESIGTDMNHLALCLEVV